MSSCERPMNRPASGCSPFVGVEEVLLLHADPGKGLAHAGDLVAVARVLLLGLQQRQARVEVFPGGSDPVFGHGVLLSLIGLVVLIN